jgi:hypothetical protein
MQRFPEYLEQTREAVEVRQHDPGSRREQLRLWRAGCTPGSAAEPLRRISPALSMTKSLERIEDKDPQLIAWGFADLRLDQAAFPTHGKQLTLEHTENNKGGYERAGRISALEGAECVGEIV